MDPVLQSPPPEPYRGMVLLAYGLVALGLVAYVWLASRRAARAREDLDLARSRLDRQSPQGPVPPGEGTGG